MINAFSSGILLFRAEVLYSLVLGAGAVSVIEDGECVDDGFFLIHTTGLVGKDRDELGEVDGSRGLRHHLIEFLVTR